MMTTLPASFEPLRELAPGTERGSDYAFIEWTIATAYDHAHASHDEVVRGKTRRCHWEEKRHATSWLWLFHAVNLLQT